MKSMSDQRKKSILMAIIVSVVLIIGIVVLLYFELKPKKEAKDLLNEFYEVYESKDLEVIYYASSSCGYCTLQTPILETIASDYDMDYLKIDATKLSSSQRKEIADKLDIEGATPTTVVVENGKVVATQEGYLEGNDYVEFLKNAGVLDENAVYSGEENLTYIDYVEYKNLVNSSTPTIIVIGQTGCGYCTQTKPVINKIAGKYNITINYLNISNMQSEDYSEFKDKLEDYGYDEESYLKEKSIGTPLTLVFKEGRVIGYLNGAVPNVKYVNLFKKVGIIKE